MTAFQNTVATMKTSFGTAYSFSYLSEDREGGTHRCDALIVFGPKPSLIWGDRLVSIDDPSRFGTWSTHRDRLQFCENFAR